MKPLGSLPADPDSEQEESEPENEPQSEPLSPYAEKAIRHLESMHQKLYPGKESKDFVDGWQGFVEITAAIDEAT